MTYQSVKLGMMGIKIDLGQIKIPQTQMAVEMETVAVDQICPQAEITEMEITVMTSTQIQAIPSEI